MTQLLERRYGPVYVNDITKDFDMVESIFAKDFSGIMAPGATVCVKLVTHFGAGDPDTTEAHVSGRLNMRTHSHARVRVRGPFFIP